MKTDLYIKILVEVLYHYFQTFSTAEKINSSIIIIDNYLIIFLLKSVIEELKLVFKFLILLISILEAVFNNQVIILII